MSKSVKIKLPSETEYIKQEPYVGDDGIYVPVNSYVPAGCTGIYQLIMTKEMFIEAYNKWIKDTSTTEAVHAHWTGKIHKDYSHAEGFADWFTEEDKKAYIDMFEHTTHCSNCLGGFDDRQIRNWKCCPYCGAIMDGAEPND